MLEKKNRSASVIILAYSTSKHINQYEARFSHKEGKCLPYGGTTHKIICMTVNPRISVVGVKFMIKLNVSEKITRRITYKTSWISKPKMKLTDLTTIRAILTLSQRRWNVSTKFRFRYHTIVWWSNTYVTAGYKEYFRTIGSRWFLASSRSGPFRTYHTCDYLLCRIFV